MLYEIITVIDPVLYYYRRDNENAMRIRKSTSYRKFVKCMEDVTFRKGIDFADPSMCSLFETVLFWMFQHRFYILYALWAW